MCLVGSRIIETRPRRYSFTCHARAVGTSSQFTFCLYLLHTVPAESKNPPRILHPAESRWHKMTPSICSSLAGAIQILLLSSNRGGHSGPGHVPWRRSLASSWKSHTTRSRPRRPLVFCHEGHWILAFTLTLSSCCARRRGSALACTKPYLRSRRDSVGSPAVRSQRRGQPKRRPKVTILDPTSKHCFCPRGLLLRNAVNGL